MPLSSTIYNIPDDAAIGETEFQLVFATRVAHPPGYLSRDHIFLWVNDELHDTIAGGAGPNGFTFTDANNVVLKTYSPADGDKIEFRRTMPVEDLFTNFVDGSGITESQLDTSALGSLYIGHEIKDGFGTGITSYYALSEEAAAIAYNAQLAAEAAQAAAELAETGAETAETNAETAETNSEAWNDLAEKWATESEDVVVEDGKYSAYHWAQKAEESGGGGTTLDYWEEDGTALVPLGAYNLGKAASVGMIGTMYVRSGIQFCSSSGALYGRIFNDGNDLHIQSWTSGGDLDLSCVSGVINFNIGGGALDWIMSGTGIFYSPTPKDIGLVASPIDTLYATQAYVAADPTDDLEVATKQYVDAVPHWIDGVNTPDDDDDVGDYYLKTSDGTVYEFGVLPGPGVVTAKTVIVEIAGPWGDSTYTGIRQIDFYYQGTKLEFADTDITCDQTTRYDADHLAKWAFITSTSKTGDTEENAWLSASSANRLSNRLLCTFDFEQTFDEIVISNGHGNVAAGTGHTDRGAANVHIWVSDDVITDTTYEAALTNETLVFWGTFGEHSGLDEADDETILDLTVDSRLTGYNVCVEGYTEGLENSGYTGGAFDGELTDGNISGAWYAQNPSGTNVTSGWTGQNFGAGNAKTVVRYSVRSFDDPYAPKTWTFEGSESGVWAGDAVILDTQTDIEFASVKNTRYFDIDNTSAYQYYRVNVSENNGSSTHCIIQEIEMFEVSEDTAVSPGDGWMELFVPDDRYYSQTEVDAELALKADLAGAEFTGNVSLLDDQSLVFGDGSDATIKWDSADSQLEIDGNVRFDDRVGFGIAPSASYFINADVVFTDQSPARGLFFDVTYQDTTSATRYYKGIELNMTDSYVATGVVNSGYWYGINAATHIAQADHNGEMKTLAGFLTTTGLYTTGAAGHLENAYGLKATGYFRDGTIENLHGVSILLDGGASGTVTDTIACFYGTVSGGGATLTGCDVYGIYITGETDNYLSGNLEVGEILTTPSQPSFGAYITTTVANITAGSYYQFNSTNSVAWTEEFDTNSDFSSGVFTAPVTGVYQLSLRMRVSSLDSAASLYTCGIQHESDYHVTYFDPAVHSGDLDYHTFSVSITVHMTAGDEATPVLNQTGGSNQADVSGGYLNYTYFSGHLVG